MSQSTQQQQQHDSNSNCNVTKPQIQPWLMSDPDTEELETLLAINAEEWKTCLAPDSEEWKTWFATKPNTNTNTQQPTTVWTRSQDKALENALVTCPEGMENRWERIAALVPGGKTPAEVSKRYEQLLHDISLINSGQVELPIYKDELTEAMTMAMAAAAAKVDGGRMEHTAPANGNNRRECWWTEEEHRLFLNGLQKCGKVNWTDIARRYVVTKNAKQVASHAQKYFLHQSDIGKKRKRKSIHDITI